MKNRTSMPRASIGFWSMARRWWPTERRPTRCRGASCAGLAISPARRDGRCSNCQKLPSGIAMRNNVARKSLLAVGGLAALMSAAMGQPTEWKDWGGDAARMHYSALNQITATNVSGLKPAWVWDSGKLGRSWEITPLLIDGLLYISENQSGDIIALEPETGKEVWRTKPPVTAGKSIDRRGLAYWAGDGAMKPRIVAIWGHVMFGLDLKTGAWSADWPTTGLDIGLPNPAAQRRIGGGVFAASPPIIYKNFIITTAASGFQPPPAQPADPHANDLRTGKLVWTSRLIPGARET